MRKKKRERQVGAFVFGVVLGGIAGAAYGLWTAPQAGAMTRQRLTDQARSIVQQAEQVMAALVDEGERLIESGRSSIAALAERAPKTEREPEPAVPAAPAAADEVIATVPVPPATPTPTDEVIEGPRPASPPPQSAPGESDTAHETAGGGRA